MNLSLKESIKKQREHLTKELGSSLQNLANQLIDILEDKEKVDQVLANACKQLSSCKHIYVVDTKGIQISSTLGRDKVYQNAYGRNRASRPYMQILQEDKDFVLSDSYISKNKKRPSLTAVQAIKNKQGKCIGYLGVDYDLRELPYTGDIYKETDQWRQIKGDPSIRSSLFTQQRVESLLDKSIDDVLYLIESLILEHGVHHTQIHFSSSRATIWHVDDPYIYRILTIDELLDPDICLAYPRRPYFERAIVPSLDIIRVFEQFKALRFMDETIYLRSGSLNIVNGFIGLNFSCDGTHYLGYDEFLSKGMDFWLQG